MGISIRTAELFWHLKSHGYFDDKSKVLDIGSQELMLRTQDLKDIGMLESDYIASTKDFYLQLGLSEYASIDLDENDGALGFDLNTDIYLTRGFDSTFDFIYNGGTSEHCFNQYAFFQNIHNLCSIGGLMFHQVPISGGYDHGYFSYHPRFFYDLALANGYEVELSYLIDEKGHFGHLDLMVKDGYRALLHDVFDQTKSLMSVFVFRKIADTKFCMPYQVSNALKTTHFFSAFSEYYSAVYKKNVLKNISNVAIFGCGLASDIAVEFCKKFNIGIKCFIDDYKIGSHKGAPVVGRDSQIILGCQAVLFGPKQKVADVSTLNSLACVYLHDSFICMTKGN